MTTETFSENPDEAAPDTQSPGSDPDKLEIQELLRRAALLRQEQDDIDGMFAALRDEDETL